MKILAGVFILFGIIEALLGSGLSFILLANTFHNITVLIPLFVLIVLGVLSVYLNIKGIKNGGNTLNYGLMVGGVGLAGLLGLSYYVLNVMNFS